MLGAKIDHYGPPEVVVVQELPEPQPGKGQLLVRVHAAAVSSGDARIRGARFPPGFGVPARLAFGVRRPRRPVLGGAFCGEVVGGAGAEDGTGLGTIVAGMTGMALGAHAELVAVDRARAVAVPDGVSARDAAGVLFGGTTARHFLRVAGGVGPGVSVLVNGASGAIGTNAVQIAASAGAAVTAVSSGANAGLVADLGAAHVIDYAELPLSEVDERFDIVLDAVGNLDVASGRRLVAPGGVVVLAAAGLGATIRARGQVKAGAAPERTDDMSWLLERVALGDLAVVLDRVGGLDDIVQMHRRVDTGRKVGNVLVEP